MNTKTLNILLWVAQVILAIMFIMAGGMKTFQPIKDIAISIPWVTEAPVLLIRFIGLSELLGGLGLLLPSLLKIKPTLSVLAAYGLVIVMILATIFHVFRGEFQAIGMCVFLGLAAYFIAWGRSKKVKIA